MLLTADQVMLSKEVQHNLHNNPFDNLANGTRESDRAIIADIRSKAAFIDRSDNCID